MAKSYDVKKYAGCFDDNFCLKPPVALVLSIIFLCRSFLLLGVVVLTSMKGTTSNLAEFLPGGDHPSSLALTGIPALLVLWGLVRRTPRGGRLARWAWKYGRPLLAASALMEIGVAALFVYANFGAPGDSHVATVVLLILDFYILCYMLASRRVRDTFSDFPPPLDLLEGERVTEP